MGQGRAESRIGAAPAQGWRRPAPGHTAAGLSSPPAGPGPGAEASEGGEGRGLGKGAKAHPMSDGWHWGIQQAATGSGGRAVNGTSSTPKGPTCCPSLPLIFRLGPGGSSGPVTPIAIVPSCRRFGTRPRAAPTWNGVPFWVIRRVPQKKSFRTFCGMLKCGLAPLCDFELVGTHFRAQCSRLTGHRRTPAGGWGPSPTFAILIPNRERASP